MRLARVFPLCALAVAMAATAAARDTKADPTKSNEDYAPGTANAIPPELKTPEMADHVQRQRVTPDLLEQPKSGLQDDRSPLELKERREKTMIRPEVKTQKVKTYDLNRFQGRRSKFNTGTDTYRTGMAERYQRRIDEVSRFPTKEPVIGQQASLDQINRFSFQRNGVEETPVIAKAGQPAPSADQP